MERALRSRDLSANQADAYGYASAGEARPNAVSQVRLANGSLRRYGYDASGNLVCQTDDGQSGSCDQWPQFEAYYNHNQQPSYQRRKASGSGATAQYAESWYSYGADQQPARQWGIERIEGCTLDSLGCLRHHRIHLDRYEDSVGTLRHIDGRARQARTRAYIGDYLVATRGDAGQLELSYLLRDRLGSVVGVEQVTLSDRRISGLTPETRHAFDAFGAPRSNRWWSANRWHDIGTWYSPTRTQQGFTGHERLSGLQLIHMRGRVFDPVLGRFHGVDPIIQFPLSSQGLNPYSYLLNNPMAGVDPTGYASMPPEERQRDEKRRADTSSICFKSPGSCSLVGVVFGGRNQQSNGAERQQISGTTNSPATSAESIMGLSSRPTQCTAGDPAGLGPQRPLGVHRPLTSGEAFAFFWDLGVRKLPLADGGKTITRLLAEDGIQSIGQTIDGNLWNAAISAVPFFFKPAKAAKELTDQLDDRVPVVTEKALSRIESHLDSVLRNQDLTVEFQAGERAMLARLRSGERSSQDIEFFMHELKESAVFRRTGDLIDAHRKALEFRRANERDLFHSDVIKEHPEIFNESWRQP